MRGVVVSLLLLLGACASEPEVGIAFHSSPKAIVQLKKLDASLTLTSATRWTLDKVGSVGAATVTWQATATKGATTSGLVIVNGVFRVRNKGHGGAPIGNIVVNLQTKVKNKWVTRASVIADATQDDAATTALVSPRGNSERRSSFTEGPASRSLLFTDATTNSAFALVPQVTVAPGTVVDLLFSASYDNNILGIVPGTQVRAEVIVTFGNARAGHHCSPNIDINGNGIIDPDERWVHSVSDTERAIMPVQQPSNDDVELVDRVEDITTTGTVTFSNPQIVINDTTAFVTVDYNGGTDGGTITNCAHLTSTGQTSKIASHAFPNVQGVDLTACSTLVIGPHTCTPGTVGCGWEDGDVLTYTQDVWGNPSTVAGVLLVDYFNAVYAAASVLEVGIPGAAGFSMVFSSASAVLAYQPSVGTPAALNSDLLDPTTSASGVFGGEVVALQLNVDFSDAGHLHGTSSVRFGDLTLCNLPQTALDGTSVRSFLALANTALGGGATPYTISEIYTIAAQLNGAFADGSVSTFGQQNVFNGACPP